MVDIKDMTGIWEQYDVSDNTLVRNNKFSPKAKGCFLAEHKNRRTCGRTGYTEFSKE